MPEEVNDYSINVQILILITKMSKNSITCLYKYKA